MAETVGANMDYVRARWASVEGGRSRGIAPDVPLQLSSSVLVTLTDEWATVQLLQTLHPTFWWVA